ncbi:response regulator [Nocardia sp. NPDC049526]|uniref:response regulator n=1 Tax=Nocardia sp. NPDC049526 TaxID=3364316 RepID=UPI0037B834F7
MSTGPAVRDRLSWRPGHRCTGAKFPLAGMRARSALPDTQVMVLSAQRLRCFIVDDSVDFLDAGRELLEREGITVVGVASTSGAALRGVVELEPDVTLVDIELGEENGFELAERLHRYGGHVPPPVILTSAHAGQDFADMVAASHAVGFLAKSALSSGAIHELLAAEDRGDPLSEHRER